jgi:hypothetical protein
MKPFDFAQGRLFGRLAGSEFLKALFIHEEGG